MVVVWQVYKAGHTRPRANRRREEPEQRRDAEGEEGQPTRAASGPSPTRPAEEDAMSWRGRVCRGEMEAM